MNREQRGILYGLAIGDGHLSCRERKTKDKNGVPKYKYTSAELCIGHSPKQRDYLEHKADLLVSIFGGNRPKISFCTHNINDMQYTTCRIAKSSTYFRQMHSILYSTGKKVITPKVLSMLTEHSVALWYMDDGSIRCNKNNQGDVTSISCSIATMCSLEEANLIIDWFGKTWGIEAKLRPSKGKYDIGFNTKASHRLADLITPYMIPSMMYKFRFLEDFVLRKSARHPHFNMQDDDIVRPSEKQNH